ncbi:MAG TPA: hypothetical protein DDZ51_21245 [Planctomycetaceae bacterium]|nr:hypothetical protein [Planctomycetaceae bacterium]
MRLPEPSSSQGGTFATPLRGRDSSSFVQSPTGNGVVPAIDPSAGIGFFRSGVDFTSIFSRDERSNGSAPLTSQSGRQPPTSSESTKRVRQADSNENSIEPLDEDDDAVEENVSIAAQPLVVVAEVPQAVENSEVVQKRIGRPEDTALDAEKDPTNELPADPTAETPTATHLTKSTGSIDAEKLAASKSESSIKNELSHKAGDTESAGDNSPRNQENTLATTADGVASEKSQSLDAESTSAGIDDSPRLQIARELGEKTGPAVQAGNVELAAVAQPQVAASQSTATAESEPGTDRTIRNGRGRNAGNGIQKGRTGQSESPAATRDSAAATGSESVAGQPDLIDPPLASETVDGTAAAESLDTTVTPAEVQASLSESGIVVGQAVGANTPDAAGRPVDGGGPSGELAAVAPSSSDSSGRNGEPSTSRNAENLSRTDIADRARLIHRISKAFTKMGVDGGQIRMKMHPEALGGVLLEMRVRGRNVEATVTADNEAARGLLQQQLSELRQRLESQGLTVQRLEVALRDETATGGSFLNDHRGDMSGGDRGSDGYGQSRRYSGSQNADKNGSSAAINGIAVLGQASVLALSRGPAPPGTLDLRL